MSEAALDRANRILRRIEPLVYARRGLTMTILLVITLFLGYEAALIRPDAGFDKSIPLEHQYMKVYKQYEADFGGANTVLVALEQKSGGDIYNEKFLTRLKQVTDATFFLPGIDRSHVSSLFTPDVRYIEITEEGFSGANVIPSDYSPTPEMFAKVRDNVGKAGIIGRYVSKDQRSAMVFANLLEIDPVNGKKLDYGDVAKRIESEIRNKYQDQDIAIHVVGFAKVVGDVIEQTQSVVFFFGVTLIMTMVLLWWYVASFRLALLPLICSIAAVIWEFGLLKLFGHGLDPFATLVPFLILAVSVSHGVQYCNAWMSEVADNGHSSLEASLFTWRRLAIYGTMAIMTDVAGFAMIGLIPIEIIQEMALNACFGMLAIIITNKVMMPILLSWVQFSDPAGRKAAMESRNRVLEPLWNVIVNITKPVPAALTLVVCALLLAWSLWQGRGLQIGDSQAGVPELLPDSVYNRDNAFIVGNFALGTDVMKVIAETDADACTQYSVMNQIDRMSWHLQNTEGVQSALSLPQLAKLAYSGLSEGSPKFETLPRNKDAMVQAIAPFPPPMGFLNPSCAAMPIWVFMADHRATTINRVVGVVESYNKNNSADFFATHSDVDAAFCSGKNDTRRSIGIGQMELERVERKLRNRGVSEDKLDSEPAVIAQRKLIDDTKQKLAGMDKVCPVNFALASGNVGVMAATNQVVEQLEKRILMYVYFAIIICVYVSFFEVKSLISIMPPLLLVSMMAYAVMTLLGIGMKVATLPVVALAVGIGVDYGIYIYATFADALNAGFSVREGYMKTLHMTGRAVVFTGIALGMGVATWLFSGLQFQRDMGKLLVFMFTANMFGAILVLPAIASFLLKPRPLAPGEVPVFKSRH
jgi:predicted RND superfamily exporter protein